MNPVFTLNYPELLVAEYLQENFRAKHGYSVLIPLSTQQKGYDLALMRRTKQGTRVVTFQVKSSRAFAGVPGTAARTQMRNFAFYMWLKTFRVPPEADYFVVIGQYASSPTSQKHTANLWKSQLLLFSQAEMADFMPKNRQKKLAKPETHFGFGFDRPDEAYWTRGHIEDQHPDYSHYLIGKRLSQVRTVLGEADE